MKTMQCRSLLFVALLALMAGAQAAAPDVPAASAAPADATPVPASPALPDLRMDVATGHFQGVLGWVEPGMQAPLWLTEGEAAAGIAHGPDVAYPVASVAKVFTAVAVWRLVEDDRLSLDDRLDQHWPQAEGYPAGSVTIAQLLNHQSGIPSVMQTGQGLDETLDPASWPLPASAQEQLALVLPKPLLFEPGTRYEYNNSAYLILGELLGQLTGRSGEQAVLELALGPVGLMDQACFCAALPGVPNAQLRQFHADGGIEAAPLMHHTRLGTAGGLRITARALLAWGQALQEGKILRPDTLERMWRDGLPTRSQGSTMGLGWLVRSGDGLVLHDGTIAGASSALAINRRSGRVAVGTISPTLPMDYISRSEDYIGARTTALALDKAYTELPGIGAQSLPGLDGTYRLADGSPLQLRATGTGWEVRVESGSPLTLPQTIRLEDADVQRARQWADTWMRQGQAVLSQQMSANLAGALPAGMLDAHAEGFRQQYGAYLDNYAFRRSASGKTVRLRLRYEHGHVDLGLVADGQGALDGLMLLGEPRDDVPAAVPAFLTDAGALWVDGYRHGMDAVILRPRLEDGRVSGLWIGSQDVQGAFVPKMEVHSGER